MDPVTWSGTSLLQEVDPEIHDLIKEEKKWQFSGIELISSEILISSTVNEALSHALTTKNSNGMPSNRHCYSGDQLIEALNNLCSTHTLQAFRLDPACRGVIAAAWTTFLQPYSCIMGLHPHSSSEKIYCESLPLNISTGYIDYDKLEEKALDISPKLIICGSKRLTSRLGLYPLPLHCQQVQGPHVLRHGQHHSFFVPLYSLLTLPCTHTSNTRFRTNIQHVTTTTNESSRALMAGMIFYRKRQPALYDFEDKTAVFPSLQCGLQKHQFKAYAKQVKANAVALGNYLMNKGYKLVTGGTDNHLVLWDLRPLGLTGNKVEKLCNRCGITLSKNVVFGYSSVKEPRGVLVGTHAMTRRGFVEKDYEKIGEFLHRAVTITSTIQKLHGKQKRMKDFDEGLKNNEDIKALKVDVEKFSLLH
ncbi:hypothetical protein ACJRO7_019650 [Eucalyptus globulus]|uniref:Serine hydroxymethyltransferase-like domain-containing protein n=1 Tax=Eucalyptus globulus TaxID=34317 RepID=A0ABD3KIM3_EUCGL